MLPNLETRHLWTSNLTTVTTYTFSIIYQLMYFLRDSVILSYYKRISLTPSYRHSQHRPRAPITHLFSQLQAKGSHMSRPIPVPASISFMHPLLGRPLVYPSPHANIFFRPSTLITCPKNNIFCYMLLRPAYCQGFQFRCIGCFLVAYFYCFSPTGCSSLSCGK